MPQLEDLNLMDTQLTDGGVKALANIQSLRAVALSGKVTREGVMNLKSLPNLVRQYIARGDFVSVKWLISHGANPTAADQRGMSALDVAKKYPQSVTTAEVERLIQSNDN